MKNKLTLSADRRDIAQARRLAKKRGSSISALFGRFVRATATGEAAAKAKGGRKNGNGRRKPVGRLTRQATGLISLPRGRSDRAVLADSLRERHGV